MERRSGPPAVAWEESLEPSGCRTGLGRLRAWVYLTVEEPSSSTFAQALALFLLASICVSILALIVESEAGVARAHAATLYQLEVVTTVIFTVEFVVRMLVCGEGGKSKKREVEEVRRGREVEEGEGEGPKKGKSVWSFLTSPGTVVDLLAIAPFYVELIVMSAGSTSIDVKFLKVLRAVRLVRLFRIFKVSRFANGLRVLLDAIGKSRHALYTLVFFVAVAMVIFSSAVYYAEKLLCPDFVPTEEGRREFIAYEQSCRLDVSNHLSAPCCDYACNPVNPGLFRVPESEADLELFKEERNVSEWLEPNSGFPNSLCVYQVQEHELVEVLGADLPDGYSESSGLPHFAVVAVSSSTFRSIPFSFWWAIVSMTTTGYGDEVPETLGGMCFAVLSMCFGILLIALPVAIVGSKFQEAFAQMEMEQSRKLAASTPSPSRKAEAPSTAPASPQSDTSPPASPRRERREEAAVEARDDVLANFFPALAHLVQEVPPGHPARENVQRVVDSYAELATVQAEIYSAQQGYVQAQQDFGKDIGQVLGGFAPARAARLRLQLKTAQSAVPSGGR